MLNKLIFLLIIPSIFSCKEEKKRDNFNKSISKEVIKSKTKKPIKKKDEVFIDTLTFVNYNDDSDYMVLNAKKGKDDYSFINDKNECF